MTYKTKREIEKEERIKETIQRISIKREIIEMGREPIPGEIEKIMEKRKYIKRAKNPLMEYYAFYREKIEPNIHNIKDDIEKSKTNEIKMYIDDFAKRTSMTGKHPFTIITKSKPALLIEGITANLGDKGKFIIMKKVTEKEKLTGFARNLADRLCLTDPNTDNPRILEFRNKICQLRD